MRVVDGSVRREMELCRVPLPVDVGMLGRLLSAVAAEFDDVTIRQYDDDELVVVAPREEP